MQSGRRWPPHGRASRRRHRPGKRALRRRSTHREGGGGCQRAGGEGRERQTEENELTREQAAPRGELMKKRRAALKN
jgi:hypothetical protein